MRILQNLRMDLARCGCKPIVGAVQGEANTRVLVISLFDNGVAWEAPEGATAAVAFSKPDGHKGLYDTLPDGAPATSISGSVVTITLAPQVLTTAGEVLTSVVFNDAELDQLATFPFRIRVEPNPAAGEQISNGYYKYTSMGEINRAFGESCPAIICEESGDIISINDSSDRLLPGLTLYGKTTQDGTPTPEAPVDLVTAGASGKINTFLTGKNLFGGDALADKFVEVAKATKDEAAGTVTFTANNVGGKTILRGCFKPNTRYTFILYGMCTTTTRNVTNLYVRYTDGTSEQPAFKTAGELSYCVFVSSATKTIRYLVGTTRIGSTVLHYNKCGVFEGVLTEADYIPFIGKTLTAQTPTGLNSIGEVRDEIDFVRGARVQKVGRIDSYAGEEIPGAFMSTTGELTEGATVLYALAEPIETPLTYEELAQYADLHTIKPETTVYNDAGTGMKLAYVIDTKTYIDKKLAEISAAMLNA